MSERANEPMSAAEQAVWSKQMSERCVCVCVCVYVGVCVSLCVYASVCVQMSLVITHFSFQEITRQGKGTAGHVLSLSYIHTQTHTHTHPHKRADEISELVEPR